MNNFEVLKFEKLFRLFFVWENTIETFPTSITNDSWIIVVINNTNLSQNN
jgi:hypothetical protein